MEPNSPSTNDRLGKIEDKLDEINGKLSELELSLTKKVLRNSLVINGILWVLAAITSGAIAVVVKYVT